MVEKSLRCPRCGTVTPVSTGQCVKCGLKMVKKKKSDAPLPVGDTVTSSKTSENSQTQTRAAAAPPGPAASPGAAQSATKRDGKLQVRQDMVPPGASAKSGIAMPKLHVEGLERHDDESRKANLQTGTEKRMKGLEQTSTKDNRKSVEEKGDFKSLLLEPHELDGHSVDRVSPPKASDDDTSMQNLMLAPHETFGDTAAVDLVRSTGGLADSFGFKPLYKIQEDAGPRPPGDNANYDTTGLANTIPSAHGIAHRMISSEGVYQDPYAMDSMADAPLNTDAARFKRSAPKADDGPPVDEVVHQLKVNQAKRRFFTRVLPVALIAAAVWFGGRGYVIPMLLVQGSWKGRIVDIDDHQVGMDMKLERVGRRVSGTVRFEFPKTPEGLMNPSDTPMVFGQVIHGPEGHVLGEFDVNKIYLKVWGDDSDSFMLLEGGHSYDPDGQMVVRDGKATNSENAAASFVLFRVSPF